DICASWVQSWDAEAAIKLALLADTAGDLHYKRNMIAHGTYVYTILAQSSNATNFRAVDADGNEMPFDTDILTKLYHDISHLAGDLIMKFEVIGEVKGPFFAFPDTEIL